MWITHAKIIDQMCMQNISKGRWKLKNKTHFSTYKIKHSQDQRENCSVFSLNRMRLFASTICSAKIMKHKECKTETERNHFLRGKT